MNEGSDVSVVIVNYNSVGYLRNCLRSIPLGAQHSTVEIVVIDNASFDGCNEMLSTEFPEVVFIQSPTNLGFAGANNAGFDISRGRYVLFLNPDTEVHVSAIDRLRLALDTIPDAGIVGARLLNSDCTLQTSSVTAFPSIANQVLGTEVLRTRFPLLKLWGMRALFEDQKHPVAVDAISGACIMLRRSVFEQVGGFTTDYFMYGEDVDLCMKTRKAGWKNYYVANAEITHHGGQSSKSRSQSHYADVMIRESIFQLMRKHKGGLRANGYRAAMMLVSLLRLGTAALLHPICREPEPHRALSHAWGKWSSVLRWSFGLQHWVRDEKRTATAQSPIGAASTPESIK